MKRIGVLFSSGVESSSLTALYLSEGFVVHPFYVRFGLRWERAELEHSRRIWSFFRRRYGSLLPLRILSVRGVPPRRGKLEIPMRNLLLVSTMAVEAYRRELHTVAVGSLCIHPFPDTSREYFDRLEEVVSVGMGRDFRIETPFLGVEKGEIIRRFSRTVPLHLTFSCISPVGDLHCGRCVKCAERREGFLRAGVEDPTRYLSEPSVSSPP